MSANNLPSRIIEGITRHGRNIDKFIGYGTAGFRTQAEFLDHVMFRVGIISSLRSKLTKASIGVMITASHNPEEDNGVKLVDPMGEMLELEWEKMATRIANIPDPELPEAISEIVKKHKINLEQNGSIFIGADTRVSSPILTKAVLEGIECVGGNDIVDFGLCSTPMLHYMIVCQNTSGAYGSPTHDGYIEKMCSAFVKIMGINPIKGNYTPQINIDGANGVGARIMKEIMPKIQEKLKIQLYHEGSGRLNYNCGADFVKMEQKEPEGMSECFDTRSASLDGDADRLIYFYFDSNRKFQMCDGDKIASLFAEHLGDLVKKANLKLNTGLVQTAYANGASTKYIRDVLGVGISCVPTGVKHLHHEALKFDIGIYFEANGHGTAVFSDQALRVIDASAKSGNAAGEELANFVQLINSTNGDAISDMLAVEAVLHSRGWNIEDWNLKYSDLPNKQLKVKVQDRNLIQTVDAERKVSEPKGIQEKIEAFASQYPSGRSFVRPSGTEDVVRVYAEADTQANADVLADQVAEVIREFCSGVGSKL